jgi:hypothetical protein
MARRTPTPAKVSPPPTPAIVWNGARDRALVMSLADGANTLEDVVTALSASPLFEAVPLTTAKVSRRIAILRDAGVHIPLLKRSRYTPDAATLNQLLNLDKGEFKFTMLDPPTVG